VYATIPQLQCSPAITLKNRALAAHVLAIAVMVYAIARYWQGSMLQGGDGHQPGPDGVANVSPSLARPAVEPDPWRYNAMQTDPTTVSLTCTSMTFRPHRSYPVCWLDWDADFERAQGLWPSNFPLTREIWEGAQEAGYHYCGVVEGDILVASAAVWRYSDAAWEVAAVRTLEAYRRRGYGRAVVSFATAHILAQGRVATCHTAATNLAMRRVAAQVGFVMNGGS
jgi:ribosomal protein S18 acetylase RimI-like enzyme